MSDRETTLFHRMLARRWPAVLGVVLITGGFGFFAAKVRPDYSIEMIFPRFHERRTDYERYKKDFPFEDARAIVVVTAPDVFTPAGVKRIAALEADLAKVEGVVDTDGLTTMTDVAGDDIELRMEKIVPSLDLPADELAGRVRTTATTDSLFRWTLAPPDGRATTIRVTLTKDWASKEETRTKFLRAARAVVARHQKLAADAGAKQEITLNGLPIIRSEFTEMVAKDTALLFPLALLVILILLGVTFRRLADVAAALITILFAVVWTVGVMGIFGIPLHVLSQMTPIIVMIISISDTVHILSHYKELVAREGHTDGARVRSAIASATADSAIPCLLTEVTIAGGFLALLSADMTMIQQFGIATAAGMLLTWLANVTVLPLALSFFKPAKPKTIEKDRQLSAAARLFARFIGWVEHVVVNRAGVVIGATVAIVVAAGLIGWFGRGTQYYSYDDLRPGAALTRNLRYVEAVHGGTVPLAIHIEPRTRVEDAMHEPEALALVDRIEQRLERELPNEVKNAGSIASYLRKAHRLLAGEDIAKAEPLPQKRQLIAQELLAIDDPKAMRDFMSSDHATASVFAMVPDVGSARASQIIAALEANFAAEEQAHPSYRITLTGIFGISDAIYDSLVGGLARSLGIAILVSFVIFCIVLRSWRLALLALIPNLIPLLITFGMMGALGIDIKPSTVILFSITLVIADDDTIQYLARFRRLYQELQAAGEIAAGDLHREAALRTLREAGLPMFITSLAITIGFMTLLFSQFLGLANFGLLIGISLLSAVFADLFLSPLLLIKLRPRI